MIPGAPEVDRPDQPYPARRQNWLTQLDRHAQMQPGGTALRFAGATVTWADLRERVDALAAALHRRGVGFGDRVAILLFNRPEFVETVLAVNRLGAIAVPINFRLTAAEIAVRITDCTAAALITEPALSATAVEVRAATGRVATIVVAGAEPDQAAGLLGYAALLAEPGEPAPPVCLTGDTAALIMYTSGTTGAPKGAVLTHTNLTGQVMTALYTAGTGVGDVAFIGVPLFHIAGTVNLLPGLWLGIPTVINPVGAFDAGRLLDVLAAEGVTGLFLVPAQWQQVCAEQAARPRAVRLRTLSWGGEPATQALLRRLAATFPHTRVLASFGQTEMSPVTCLLAGLEAPDKLGSVGRVVPTVAARVVDEAMNDVPPGQVGEIVYRAPTLMAGYWNDPAGTAAAFRGGWFHSGDLVRVDADGYVWVVDRVKDMIISGGENIYCAEVENALADHPRIAEVAVIGRPDPRWGEVPVAVVVAAGPLTAADLDNHLTGRLARYKHPRVLHLVDALPRNPAGKVVKTELRRRYGELATAAANRHDSSRRASLGD